MRDEGNEDISDDDEDGYVVPLPATPPEMIQEIEYRRVPRVESVIEKRQVEMPEVQVVETIVEPALEGGFGTRYFESGLTLKGIPQLSPKLYGLPRGDVVDIADQGFESKATLVPLDVTEEFPSSGRADHCC
jgi:hypothetical protein